MADLESLEPRRNPRLRVLLAIKSLCPAGAERALVNLATSLDRTRFEVHVLCVSEAGPLVQELLAADVPVTVVHKRSKVDLPVIWRIKRVLERFRPHIIHTFMSTAGLWIRPVAKLVGTPVVIHAVRCAPSSQSRVVQFLDQLLLPITNHVTVVSEANRAEFLQIFRFPAEQTTVIRNGVIIDRYEAPSDLSAAPTVLGSMGRLEEQKGFDLLLKAFAILCIQFPECRLRIAGDGSLRNRLEGQVNALGLSDHVEFCGHVVDVPAFLHSLDIYVSMTRFEGIPNAHLEAMASGLPVITTAVDGIPEIIDHERTGYLTPAGDVTAFADAMILGLSNPQALVEMGRRARDEIRSRWTIQQITNEYEGLYRNLARQAGVAL